jgi:hypothetical protein
MIMSAFLHVPAISRRPVAACLGLVLSLAATSQVAAQTPVAQYSALAVNQLSTTPGAGTTPVNIVVTRWTTATEREALLARLVEDESASALREDLSKMPPAGSIAATGSTGIELRYAHREPGPDDTERVVLITDRPMSFGERRDAGRSTDHPFTVIELRLQPNGEGEGKASIATRISIAKDSRMVVLENYTDQPVGLRSVKRLPSESQ